MAGNCTVYGGLEDPVDRSALWSGVLALVCSVFCVLLMAVDVTRSWYRWNMTTITCRFFVFDALMLELLDFSSSVSLEDQEPMPGHLDQLAKVAGVVFVCVSMNHAMPSLGQMGELSIISTNLIPLGMFVVNAIYKVWAQCRTGLVTKFVLHLKVSTIVMATIYALLISHSFIVPTTKKRLESQFYLKHREILRGMQQNDSSSSTTAAAAAAAAAASAPKFTTWKLKMYIQKYWLMALTCSPNYSLRASGVSQAVSLLTIFLCSFFLHILPSPRQLRQWNCLSMSGYLWSTTAIFFVQVTGIVLGLVIAISRSYSASLIVGRHNFKDTFVKYGRHVMLTPRDWKNQPLSPDYMKFGGLLFHARNVGATLLMVIHVTLVCISWLVVLLNQLVGLLLFFPLVFLVCLCRNKDDDGDNNQEEGGAGSSSRTILPTASSDEDDLRSYVLNLDWADGHEQSVVKKWKDEPEEWIQRGRGRRPVYLHLVLDQYCPWPSHLGSSIGQHFVGSFQTVASSHEVLKDCWSLHLMTIACIVKVVFREHSGDVEMEELTKGVHEGFRYAKFVDENVTKPSDEALGAAETVEQNLRYRNRWVNRSLRSIVCVGSTKKARIDRLREESLEIMKKYRGLRSHACELPVEAIAAKSMHTVATAMLEKFDDGDWSFQFEQCKEALAIVLTECLAKLPEAIFHQCSRGSFGSRESAVRLAAEVLGETEGIWKDPEMEFV